MLGLGFWLRLGLGCDNTQLFVVLGLGLWLRLGLGCDNCFTVNEVLYYNKNSVIVKQQEMIIYDDESHDKWERKCVSIK